VGGGHLQPDLVIFSAPTCRHTPLPSSPLQACLPSLLLLVPSTTRLTTTVAVDEIHPRWLSWRPRRRVRWWSPWRRLYRSAEEDHGWRIQWQGDGSGPSRSYLDAAVQHRLHRWRTRRLRRPRSRYALCPNPNPIQNRVPPIWLKNCFFFELEQETRTRKWRWCSSSRTFICSITAIVIKVPYTFCLDLIWPRISLFSVNSSLVAASIVQYSIIYPSCCWFWSHHDIINFYSCVD
jgi:hypothetical protein